VTADTRVFSHSVSADDASAATPFSSAIIFTDVRSLPCNPDHHVLDLDGDEERRNGFGTSERSISRCGRPGVRTETPHAQSCGRPPSITNRGSEALTAPPGQTGFELPLSSPMCLFRASRLRIAMSARKGPTSLERAAAPDRVASDTNRACTARVAVRRRSAGHPG
jgi:hypothetical protein